MKSNYKSWFKPDIKKIRQNNYIGDKIIIEKTEIEESD